jgi:hypothetical protein
MVLIMSMFGKPTNKKPSGSIRHEPSREGLILPEQVRDEQYQDSNVYGRRKEHPHNLDPHYTEPRIEPPPIPAVDLRKLEVELSRNPLDEIAKMVLALRYGEMISFDEGIRKADKDNLIPQAIALAVIFHAWATNQLKGDESNGKVT